MKIILYIMDSLRSDHLSCYGYRRKTSPNVDALTSDAVLFENAFSASTWTRPSAASILTGRYPLHHGVETFYSNLQPGIPGIPGILKSEKFTCAAFSTIAQVSKSFGFDQDFDTFRELFRDENRPDDRTFSHETGSVLPSSQDLNDALFPWIKQHAAEDFFVLAWSIDTHVPYNIPIETAEYLDDAAKKDGFKVDYKASSHAPPELQRIKDMYDSCIFYNDYNLGRLCAFLKELEIYDDCLFIMAGDHGEIFNERLDPKSNLGQTIVALKSAFSARKKNRQEYYGRRGHIDVPPYDESTKVPLIIKFPENRLAGRRVGNLVSLVDLAPTITGTVKPGLQLEWFNFDGRNLYPLITDESDRSVNDFIYCSEKSYPHCPDYYSIRSTDWKYILSEPPEFSPDQFKKDKMAYLARYLRQRYLLAHEVLFDLKAGGENENVLNRNQEVAQSFRKQLSEWRKQCEIKHKSISHTTGLQTEMDEVNERQLKALGYMS